MKQNKTTILLSIKPEYANKIFSGEKRYELRKTRFKKPIDRVIVYSMLPVGKIIGEFSVRRIHYLPLRDMWERVQYNAGIDKDAFYKYYEGRSEATAIEALYIKPYNEEAFDPKERYKNFKAPQSFMYWEH